MTLTAYSLVKCADCQIFKTLRFLWSPEHFRDNQHVIEQSSRRYLNILPRRTSKFLCKQYDAIEVTETSRDDSGGELVVRAETVLGKVDEDLPSSGTVAMLSPTGQLVPFDYWKNQAEKGDCMPFFVPSFSGIPRMYRPKFTLWYLSVPKIIFSGLGTPCMAMPVLLALSSFYYRLLLLFDRHRDLWFLCTVRSSLEIVKNSCSNSIKNVPIVALVVQEWIDRYFLGEKPDKTLHLKPHTALQMQDWYHLKTLANFLLRCLSRSSETKNPSSVYYLFAMSNNGELTYMSGSAYCYIKPWQPLRKLVHQAYPTQDWFQTLHCAKSVMTALLVIYPNGKTLFRVVLTSGLMTAFTGSQISSQTRNYSNLPRIYADQSLYELELERVFITMISQQCRYLRKAIKVFLLVSA
uniref:Catechin oxygenase n=1 Tax=Acinetobacter calcoaceticus TaxID=471 RepID=Q93T32_ACICA|nr:catechin oxygenase [Acinetobacter calcoaceticus]